MKSKYETNILPKLFLVEMWARDGLTERQIADNLGVAMSTFCLYKGKYSELLEALRKGKEVADYEVENALFKKACGFTYEEKVKELVLDPETGEEEWRITKVVEKTALPDTTAQIYWLKNRKPDIWRDKREQKVDLSGMLVNFSGEVAEEEEQRFD